VKGQKMASNKTEVTPELTATAKAPSISKHAAKSVKKQIPVEPVVISAEPPKLKPKTKTVRDFSIPHVEYRKIAVIKEVCLKAGVHAKRSVILRAGLKVLSEMNADQLVHEIAGLSKKNESLLS
jgi:hypothetical protein